MFLHDKHTYWVHVCVCQCMCQCVCVLLDDFTSWGISMLSTPHLVTSVKWLPVIMLLTAALQSSGVQSRGRKILLFLREVLMLLAADLSKGKKKNKKKLTTFYLLLSNWFTHRSVPFICESGHRETRFNERTVTSGALMIENTRPF